MYPQETIKKLEDHFGSRVSMLGNQLLMLSMLGQPCDVTFYKKKPALNVEIDQKINIALLYGVGAEKLKDLFEGIELSNGDRVSITDIWTINPMPSEGFSEEMLAAVDLSEGDEMSGPNNETLRQIISETYHCQSREEEDWFLRRFIAS